MPFPRSALNQPSTLHKRRSMQSRHMSMSGRLSSHVSGGGREVQLTSRSPDEGGRSAGVQLTWWAASWHGRFRGKSEVWVRALRACCVQGSMERSSVLA